MQYLPGTSINTNLWYQLRRGSHSNNARVLDTIYTNLQINQIYFKNFASKYYFTLKQQKLLLKMFEISQNQNCVSGEFSRKFLTLLSDCFPMDAINRLSHEKLRRTFSAQLTRPFLSDIRLWTTNFVNSLAARNPIEPAPEPIQPAPEIPSFVGSEEENDPDPDLTRALEISMQSYEEEEQKRKRPRLTMPLGSQYTCGFPSSVLEERLKGQLAMEEDSRPKCPICLEPPTDFTTDLPRLLQLKCGCLTLIHHSCLERQLALYGVQCPVCKKLIENLRKL
jgi:hypothetical protein